MRPLSIALVLLVPLSAEARLTPECQAGLAKADALAKKGRDDEARAALEGLEKSDPPEGGECTARVLQRRGDLTDDPRLMLAFLYSTILGVATDLQAQRAFGVPSSPAGLRRLRRELFAFVRAAVVA